MNRSLPLEVCVDDPAGLAAAVEGGADRVELCSALDLGGVTPSTGLMAEAKRLGIPAIALIRPRAGDFHYTAADARVMLADIERAATLGLAGVAIGALARDGRLDLPMVAQLAAHARQAGLQLTLHRAFDLVPDQAEALEQAVSLGFRRILTSGGAPQAPMGAAQLRALVGQSRDRIRILAGSGITPDNVNALLAASGVHEVHASCRAPGLAPVAQLVAFGFSAAASRRTSAAVVIELRRRLLAQAAPDS